MPRPAVVALVLLVGCSSPTSLLGGSPYDSHLSDPYLLLSASQQAPLHLVFVATQGIEPGDEAKKILREELERALPPDAFEFVDSAYAIPPRGAEHRWSSAQLHELRNELAVLHPREDGPTVIVAYVDGDSDQDFGPLAGVAIRNMAVLFYNGMAFAGLQPPLPSVDPAVPVLERAVLVHEVGHVLGLVGFVEQTSDRRTHASEDPCACHSTNEDSVMNAGVAYGNALVDAFYETGYIPYRFDAHDVADLRLARQVGQERYA